MPEESGSSTKKEGFRKSAASYLSIRSSDSMDWNI
jgi:hypothetical protein